MRWLIAIVASSLVLVASAIEAPKPGPGTPPAKEDRSKDQPAETPPAAPTEEKPTDDSTPAPDTAPPEGEEEEEELPPLPPGTVPSGPPPARFDPTEKVRADFPVSFPIDI
jgi:hypothetical protein